MSASPPLTDGERAPHIHILEAKVYQPALPVITPPLPHAGIASPSFGVWRLGPVALSLPVNDALIAPSLPAESPMRCPHLSPPPPRDVHVANSEKF